MNTRICIRVFTYAHTRMQIRGFLRIPTAPVWSNIQCDDCSWSVNSPAFLQQHVFGCWMPTHRPPYQPPDAKYQGHTSAPAHKSSQNRTRLKVRRCIRRVTTCRCGGIQRPCTSAALGAEQPAFIPLSNGYPCVCHHVFGRGTYSAPWPRHFGSAVLCWRELHRPVCSMLRTGRCGVPRERTGPSSTVQGPGSH